MSLEAWGDENPHDADYDTWADRATDAGWFDPDDFSPGAIAIMRERERQETEEGWTPAHDDRHAAGELASAAACYSAYRGDTAPEEMMGAEIIGILWPFEASWWKPKNARADLVRAGALIAAEIDRLDRLEKPSS